MYAFEALNMNLKATLKSTVGEIKDEDYEEEMNNEKIGNGKIIQIPYVFIFLMFMNRYRCQ